MAALGAGGVLPKITTFISGSGLFTAIVFRLVFFEFQMVAARLDRGERTQGSSPDNDIGARYRLLKLGSESGIGIGTASI